MRSGVWCGSACQSGSLWIIAARVRVGQPEEIVTVVEHRRCRVAASRIRRWQRGEVDDLVVGGESQAAERLVQSAAHCGTVDAAGASQERDLVDG